MFRSRLLICLLLAVTSVHVLLADSLGHEHEWPTPGSEMAWTQISGTPASNTAPASLLDHCCQCQGMMALRFVTLAAPLPPASFQTQPAPQLPLSPLFDIDRPPILS